MLFAHLGEVFLQCKDRTSIKIDSVAFGGDGVGRVDDFVVFVPFAAPGDELEIEITQRKKKFARGKISRVINPSKTRVDPFCRHYGTCGGCCYQHINYEAQLKIKKRQVADAFEKIGGIPAPPVGEIIASPRIYHYRGKARLHAAKSKLGFMDVSGAKVVDIERCEIVEETINARIGALRRDKTSLPHRAVEYAIWSGASAAADENELIIREVQGKTFFVPREGFFQANLYLTEKLVEEVCRLSAATKVETLVDAYCGSGLFSVFLSGYAQNIFGIEYDQAAVACARRNAAAAGANNVCFYAGDVENVLADKFCSQEKPPDMVLLDPPRIGCSASVLRLLARVLPRRIIYISCNPATQARDVKFLCEQGYRLVSLLPLDMFSQTQHIEVIGVLEAIGKE